MLLPVNDRPVPRLDNPTTSHSISAHNIAIGKNLICFPSLKVFIVCFDMTQSTYSKVQYFSVKTFSTTSFTQTLEKVVPILSKAVITNRIDTFVFL